MANIDFYYKYYKYLHNKHWHLWLPEQFISYYSHHESAWTIDVCNSAGDKEIHKGCNTKHCQKQIDNVWKERLIINSLFRTTGWMLSRLWSSAWRRLFTSGEGAKPCQQFVRVVGLMSFFLVLIFFFICKEKKGMFSLSDPPLEGRVGSRRGRSLTFFVSSW